MGKSAMTAKAALAAKAQEAKACKLAAAQERQGKEKNQFISAKQSSEHRGASKIKELLPFGPKGIKPAPPVPEKVNKHPRYPLVGTQFEHHCWSCKGAITYNCFDKGHYSWCDKHLEDKRRLIGWPVQPRLDCIECDRLDRAAEKKDAADRKAAALRAKADEAACRERAAAIAAKRMTRHKYRAN